MTLLAVRIVTADGRSVAVGGSGPSAASLLSPSTPPWSGAGKVRVAKGRDGTVRTVTYAQIARTNPWVRAAVDARASVASRVPLHVYRVVPDAGEHDADRIRLRPGGGGDGAQLPRLLSTPAPGLSGRRWRRRLLSDVLTHGNALAEWVRSGGAITELAWQPWVDVVPHPAPDRLTMETYEVPTERRDGLFLGPRARSGLKTRHLDRDEVIHFVVVDDLEVGGGPIGVSPLSSMHYTHALHEAAMRFARAYLDEGIMPTGAVELHPQATAAMAQATRELLSAVHSGVENAGAPLVLAGKWHQLSATPEGAKLVELAKYSREEVAAGYRIPLPVLGDLSSSNRSTAEASREQFVRDTVGDDVAVLETEINAQLVARNRRWSAAGIWVEGELGEQLRPDLKARSEIYDRSKHWITPNEIRRKENLPPSPDPRANDLIFDPGTPGSADSDDPDDADADADL